MNSVEGQEELLAKCILQLLARGNFLKYPDTKEKKKFYRG